MTTCDTHGCTNEAQADTEHLMDICEDCIEEYNKDYGGGL